MDERKPFGNGLHSAAGVLLLTIIAWNLPTTAPAAAQVPADTALVDPAVEALLETVDPTAGDAEGLAALLTDLAEHPLEVNTATADELAVLPALTPLLAHRITTFRRREGPFEAVGDLLAVPGLTSALLDRLRPYLVVGPPREAAYPPVPSFRDLTRELHFSLIQRMTGRLDLGRGYADDTTRTTFSGSPLRVYTRLRARAGRHLSLNLTLDKDAGEPFRWHPATQTYGYDHVSAHAALHDVGRLRTLIVGDFTAAFGQGLTLWRGSTFGKGRNPVQAVARSGRGFTPYGSTGENRFFRGVAATARLTPALSVSAFASRRTLDATVFAPDTARAPVATSLPQSGLHRTPGELARKDALGETVMGGAVDYRFERARVGMVGYRSRFDASLAPGGRPYERFHFAGRTAAMASLYANVYLGSFFLFSEFGRGPTGALGGVGGMMADLPRSAQFILLVRHLPRDLASLHGAVFSERSGPPRNETGLYLGLTLQPGRTWTLAAYVDQYRFPWLRYGVPRPSAGYDVRLVAEHRPRPWLIYYLQLRSETREQGADIQSEGGRLLDGLQRETRQSARLHADYRFSSCLRLRARIEGTRHLREGAAATYGVLLFQDVRWQPVDWLRLDARLAFFDTDGYETRIYAFENDLLYSFSIPAFAGEGRRMYLLLTASPLRRLDLQLKYAVTRYLHVEHIGSGLNETPGNRRRTLRAQLRWHF